MGLMGRGDLPPSVTTSIVSASKALLRLVILQNNGFLLRLFCLPIGCLH